MNVAQIVETLDAGGAEGLAIDIANALAARGHRSHLVVMDASGPFRRRVGADVYFTDLALPRRAGPFLGNALYFRRTYRALAGVLKARRVEVVQTHLPRSNFLGLFVGRGGLARVFPTVHNNREFDYGEHASWWKDRLRKRAYRQMLSWCRGMIAVSDQVRRAMVQELKLDEGAARRLVVVPNGVAVPPRPGAEERTRLRRRYDVGDDEVLLVGVGRLTRQKNFGSLLEALALVPDAVGPWKCLIVGEGELRDQLAADIAARRWEDRVVLTGHVSAVGELLGAADVFCLSSLYEGLPLVLLEAMAAGLPVCAYGIDGVVDVVRDGEQARLAHPEDPADLARALGDLLADPGLRRRLGNAGHALVRSRYDFERVVDRLEEVYRS